MAAAARWGEAPAVIERGETWSFNRLWAECRRAASSLLESGGFVRVADAPVLRQTVQAVWPRRHDGAGLHRRLLRISRRMLAGG